jgi:alkylhydroperoxidase family enzyme
MIGFLEEPASSDEAQRMVGEDLAELGYVMNFSRLWAYRPDLRDGLFALLGATAAGRLDPRVRSILVAACASAFGDAYCSLSYGGKLARQTGAEVAAGVLAGDDGGLDPAERCLAAWARAVARDPNATRPDQVAALREAGYGDADIFAMTVFIALRIALSTVNDALGLHPDAELAAGLPPAVRAAVTFGRPVARAAR